MKFTEGLPDDLFDTKTITEFGKALHDNNDDVSSNIIDFFTAAILKGMFCDLYLILILNSQRACETRYLIQRSSLHFNMH